MANAVTNQKSVLVDLTKCVGCGSCTVACKLWNAQSFQNPQTNEYENAHGVDVQLDSNTWTTVEHKKVNKDGQEVWRFVKRQCMHCLEPACSSVCFAHAFHQTEQGAVQYDPSVCVGCRYCMIACPFDIPKYEWEKVLPSVMKCQFCSSKLAEGEAPACASVCPTDALMFGNRDELLAKAHEIIASDSRYLNHVYGEKEVGGTSWLYISDVDFGELGFPTNLPEKSIPENVHGFTRFTIPIFAVGAAAWTGVSLYAKRRHAVAHEGHHAEEHHEEA